MDLDSTSDNNLAEPDTAKMEGISKQSEERYLNTYQLFTKWQSETENTGMFTEKVLTAYFKKMSEKHVPSTLWGIYSMLKKTINANHGIDISTYKSLIAFIKKNSEGYVATKMAKAFSGDDIQSFLEKAPDLLYLATKVAAIFGIFGACHSYELVKMTTENVKDVGGTLFLVKIPKNSKTDIDRSFTVSESYYDIVKKYILVRPPVKKTDRFFLYYKNGKCTNQPIGIHIICKMPHSIALFLNLPQPEKYTGQSFRKTSLTLLKNQSGNQVTLKKHKDSCSKKIKEEREDVIYDMEDDDSSANIKEEKEDNISDEENDIDDTAEDADDNMSSSENEESISDLKKRLQEEVKDDVQKHKSNESISQSQCNTSELVDTSLSQCNTSELVDSFISFKMYLIYGTQKEVHKFRTDKNPTFSVLREKIVTVCPALEKKFFTVTWKDEDGDDIVIASDEALMIAIAEQPDVKKITVKLNFPEQAIITGKQGNMRIRTAYSLPQMKY